LLAGFAFGKHRIVGVAEIQIPLIEGFDLAEKIGLAKAQEIENDLRSLAIRVADAVQARHE
jgi:hypothetical protein